MTTAEPEVPTDRTAATPDRVDGRRLRGTRSREGVITAILELIHEGHHRPTTAQIAERSGVSVRSVFRHFDDVESLYAAAVEVHAARVAPYWELPDLPVDTEGRIRAFVEHRLRLYEAMGEVRRSVEHRPVDSPVIAARLRQVRELHVEQVASVFAPELAAIDEPLRSVRTDAVALVTCWRSWEEATRAQGWSREHTAEVLVAGTLALLG